MEDNHPNSVPFQTTISHYTISLGPRDFAVCSLAHALPVYLFKVVNRNGLEADSELYSIYANSGILTWSNLKLYTKVQMNLVAD